MGRELGSGAVLNGDNRLETNRSLLETNRHFYSACSEDLFFHFLKSKNRFEVKALRRL
jgi:hypothetical protein